MNYSPWYWHNKALREHPEYQMEGMMDCLREEMSYSMPYQHFSTPVSDPEILEWTKRQWGEVQQLKAMVLHLSNKINEMRANASKRRPKYKYSNKK